MAKDPVVTMEAVYPGALAANAIGQLIEVHGEDIARMTYRDRKVFIGDEYSDPSIIPITSHSGKENNTDRVYREMFTVEYSGVSD
jgi:hypothetical protein